MAPPPAQEHPQHQDRRKRRGCPHDFPAEIQHFLHAGTGRSLVWPHHRAGQSWRKGFVSAQSSVIQDFLWGCLETLRSRGLSPSNHEQLVCADVPHCRKIGRSVPTGMGTGVRDMRGAPAERHARLATGVGGSLSERARSLDLPRARRALHQRVHRCGQRGAWNNLVWIIELFQFIPNRSRWTSCRSHVVVGRCVCERRQL